MTLYLQEPDLTLHHGDVRDVLRELPSASIDCCVTSPPYFGLRDYGHEAQIGIEETPAAYVANLVAVFREVRRVLAPHGTVWLNLGDSYAAGGGFAPDAPSNQARLRGESVGALHGASAANYMARANGPKKAPAGLKAKDLVGIPWRVAFALQNDGWWLRSDIIWAKPNPMPESVRDRPTSSHEYVFLLTKQPRYYYDADAIKEPASWERWGDQTIKKAQPGRASWIGPKGKNELPSGYGARDRKAGGFNERLDAAEVDLTRGRNARSVWSIPTQPYPQAHFATFPEELPRRAILAGCPTEVCRMCGTPRERIVKKSIDDERPLARQNIHPPEVTKAGQGTNATGSETWGHYLKSETVGWTECACVPELADTRPSALQAMTEAELRAEVENFTQDGPGTKWRPGVVLDPFIGSGTVGKVARDLSRHTIGIDLNDEYLELAARRISKRQQKVLAEDLKPAPDGTLNLFAEPE